MNVFIDRLDSDRCTVEIVEHKGLGHPDTICDALAEEVSVALSAFYLEHFGRILHHNVDKALLVGGMSEVRFGGGRVIEPMELYLAGRVTAFVEGTSLPVQAIAELAIRRWLHANLPNLDIERHLKLRLRFRPASADLAHLFGRGLRANDTSCGVGFAPATELERLVLAVAESLRSIARRRPEVGHDVKIMAVRTNDDVELTVACAFVAAHVPSIAAYVDAKAALAEEIMAIARHAPFRACTLAINAADDLESGSVYLTVTGLSAEAGDDGQVGRGNRVGGLITPGRPMTLEAAAGKNSVTHVGKLYGVVARNTATALVEKVEPITSAEVALVSRIGAEVDDPRVVHVRAALAAGAGVSDVAQHVRRIVEAETSTTSALWKSLLAREQRLF